MSYFIEVIMRALIFGAIWYLFNKKKYQEKRNLLINTVVTTSIFVVVSIIVERLISTLF